MENGAAPLNRPRPLRPLDLGDLVDELFAVYRRGFKTFLGIAAVVHLPLALLALPLIPAYTGYLDLLSRGSDGAEQLLRALEQGWVGMVAIGVALVIGSTIGSVLELGATCRATSAIYLGEPLTVGGAYRAALARFWPLLGLSVIVVAVMIGLWLLVFAPLGLAAAGGGALAALMCLTFPLAMVATAYLLVRWSVANPALMLEERLGPISTLRRSSALIRGAWWRSFLVLLVLLVLLYIVQLVLGGLISILQFALQAALSPGALFPPAWVTALTTLLSSLVNMVLAPLLWIGVTLLYYDRRVRAEGYDLAVMARELRQGSLPDPGTP